MDGFLNGSSETIGQTRSSSGKSKSVAVAAIDWQRFFRVRVNCVDVAAVADVDGRAGFTFAVGVRT